MKNLIWISGLLFLSVAIFGCKDSSNNNQPVPQPVVAVCASGQYYSNGSCFSGNGFVGFAIINNLKLSGTASRLADVIR